MSTKITYSHQGEAISDFNAEEYAEKLNNEDIETSSEIVILHALVLYKEKRIPEDTEFYFKNYDDEIINLEVTETGRLKHRPNVFCCEFDKCLERLLEF